LDDEKIEALRRWGESLRDAPGEESRAAGRAILLLIEELDEVRVDLLRARAEPVASALHDRLQDVLGRDTESAPADRPEPHEEAGSSAGREAETTAAQSWIAGLRRQK
jgi:hypothetical protein